MKRSGAMASFTEALASRCHPLLLSIPQMECSTCFTGNFRSQTILPNYIPSLLVGTPFIPMMQFLRAGFYELGRVRRRKWKLLINHFLRVDLITYFHDYSTYHIVICVIYAIFSLGKKKVDHVLLTLNQISYQVLLLDLNQILAHDDYNMITSDIVSIMFVLLVKTIY